MNDITLFPKKGTLLEYDKWTREAHSRIMNEVSLITPEEQSEIVPLELLIKIHKEVVKKALAVVEKNQPSDGRFNINVIFNTIDPGVKIPDWLLKEYPVIMNIILNEQYDDLNVNEDGFGVTVYMKGMPARLYIPFNAIFAFKDNIHNFSAGFIAEVPKSIMEKVTSSRGKVVPEPEEEPKDNVVSLADYRKRRNSEVKD